MKKIAFIILLIIVAGSCFAQDMQKICNKALPSVVTLRCVDVLGYGFFIDKDLVVTNYKVINKARVGAAKVVMAGTGVSYDVLGYLSANEENDLVLLKVNTQEGITLKLNETPQSKGKVYFFDNSNEQKFSLKEGNIREIKDYGSNQLIQISASIVVSSSGLPVLDENGTVIGIAVVSPVKDTNENLAIPSGKITELLKNKKETVQALKDLNPPQTIEKDKNPAKSVMVEQYLNAGNAKIYSKDYKGAIEKFTLAISLAPFDADAYVFRGQAKYLSMEYKDALEDYNKAIEIQSDYAEAWDLRGIVKAELGDKNGACEDWNKSYELGFNNAFKLLKQFCDLDKFK